MLIVVNAPVSPFVGLMANFFLHTSIVSVWKKNEIFFVVLYIGLWFGDRSLIFWLKYLLYFYRNIGGYQDQTSIVTEIITVANT